jgi:alpha-ketoglutarate-dependent taurine dioxygenase
MDALRDAYLQEQVAFEWRAGDVLVLDNMLTAHARAPFAGPRQVRVAMAQPCPWDEVAVRDVAALIGR